MSRGDDVVPIPGTKRRKYLEENLGALDVRLGREDLAEIEAVFPEERGLWGPVRGGDGGAARAGPGASPGLTPKPLVSTVPRCALRCVLTGRVAVASSAVPCSPTPP